jgi:GNAT superfamily N-acetyltransferase
MNGQEIISSFQFLYKQEGLLGALTASWKLLTCPLFEYHCGYKFRQMLNEPFIGPLPNMDVTFRQAMSSDLELFKTIVPVLRAKRFVQRIRDGEVCFMCVCEGRVLGFVWASFTGTPTTLNLGLNLQREDIYLFAAYTLPEYRKQGILSATSRALKNWLYEHGYKSAILIIDHKKKANINHALGIGYRIESEFFYLRIIKWKYLCMKPGGKEKPSP